MSKKQQQQLTAPFTHILYVSVVSLSYVKPPGIIENRDENVRLMGPTIVAKFLKMMLIYVNI